MSIQRQLDSARAYADAHGWEVVLEAIDDGVSATKHKPQDRQGWSSLLASPVSYDHVIIWKIDRLARKVIDFVVADEALQARNAGIVSIKESLDLGTDIGRMIAMILATFAQMEAKAIGERGADARRHLVNNGRRAGGRPPYGYANIDNPNGPGKVLAKSDEIVYVQRAVEMVQQGASLGALARYFNDHAPLRPRANRRHDVWDYSTVETILRNPVLAGMTIYTPGRKAGVKGSDVLRDETGMPAVNKDLAIMTIAEHRALVELLDKRKMPGTRTNVNQQAMLGLVKCAMCKGTMYKAIGGAGYTYLRCQSKGCIGQAISQPNIEAYIRQAVLDSIGDLPILEDVTEPSRLDDIEVAIADTLRRMQQQATPELFERLTALQQEKQTVPTRRAKVYDTSRRYQDIIDDADAGEIVKQVLTVYVHPATKRSNRFDPSRVSFEWSEAMHWALQGKQTEGRVHDDMPTLSATRAPEI